MFRINGSLSQITMQKCSVLEIVYKNRGVFKVSLIYRYLLLKYDQDMLLFDERFVDYGCNKVQYVDHLRLLGYQFYILTQTFAMDLVHHEYLLLFLLHS